MVAFFSARGVKRRAKPVTFGSIRPVTDYEVSASYVDALVRALGTDAKAAVIEAMPPDARRMIQDPWSDAWHPALYLEAFGEVVVKLHGPEFFEGLAYSAMTDKFGSIIMPMLKRSLETTNRSPAAILARVGSLVEMGMRGLDCTWKPAGQGGGSLQIRYPRAVAPHVDLSWRGIFTFIFEQTSEGRVVDFGHELEGKLLRYRIEW